MTYDPPWKVHEAGVHSNNPKEQIRATDAFIDHRADELRKDSRARKWEADRKKEWAKNKPLWVKQRDRQEGDLQKKAADELRDFGEWRGLSPAPGYVLILPDPAKTETDSGILLPESDDQGSLAGTVVAVGDTLITDQGAHIPCPVQPGQHVLHKKFVGVAVDVEAGSCTLMRFSDLLGVLID